MVDRMHVHKVRELEEVGWYRENMVRFMKLSSPYNFRRIFFSVVALPLTTYFLIRTEKQAESYYLNGKELDIRTSPFSYFASYFDERNGGHARDYKGPEEALAFSDRKPY
eukprot:TRINITY_DN15113_c0_g1_i1.p1 TRINITY_DN15113_c0_g1~~TRINITY_DN15113_c0_g1_i1.p1  ORF type:complete len:110 (-),score=11.99 TRINITY_DN15113_c0_g1_i1:37-366(-)